MDTQLKSLLNSTLIGLFLVLLVSGSLITIRTPKILLPYFANFYLLALTGTAIIYSWTTKRLLKSSNFLLVLQLFMTFSTFVCLGNSLSLNLPIGMYIILINVFFGATFYVNVAIPQAPKLALICFVFNISIGLALCLLNKNLPMLQMTFIIVLGNILTMVINLSRYKGLVREAGMVYEARSLVIKNEKLSRAKLEKEMLQAQEIQDSFLTPPHLLETKGLRVEYYQEKYGILGGDWMATRFLSNGDFLGVVVDVTGKGTAAALVVHAVQSLWVQASHQSQFDPITWITKLNKVLLFMGNKKTQSLTLGMVILSKNSGIFLSAGHIPLFMTETQGSHTEVKSLLGRGNVIGLSHQLEIKPISFTWNPQDEVEFFLATDGVFPKGTRTKKLEVITLTDHLKTKSHPLKSIGSEDDKILLHVSSIPQPVELRRVVNG